MARDIHFADFEARPRFDFTLQTSKYTRKKSVKETATS